MSTRSTSFDGNTSNATTIVACNASAKGRQLALQQLYTQYHRELIMQQPQDYVDDPDFIEWINRGNVENVEGIAASGRKAQWFMLTVNPPSTLDVDGFIQVVHRFAQKKIWKYVIYAFEQRSEDPEGWHGLHVHMFINKGQVRPAEVRREAHRVFDKFVGNAKHVDIRFFRDQDVQNGINYVKGVKSDQSKAQKALIDNMMRDALELDSFYEVGQL